MSKVVGLNLLGQAGGLSGAPLAPSALATLRELYRRTEGRVPLVGVGGIASAEDAYERIKAGASLVQVYTAFTLEGFGLVTRLNTDLEALLERDGLKSVQEAVGKDNPIDPLSPFDPEKPKVPPGILARWRLK